MNVLAILKDFTFRCKSVFENTTTKMSKRFLNWLILTIRTVALIRAKSILPGCRAMAVVQPRPLPPISRHP